MRFKGSNFSFTRIVIFFSSLDVIEKDNFVSLLGKGGHSGLMPSKPCVPTWGREWESFIIIVQRGSLHGHSSDGWAVRQVGISINLRSSWSGVCLFVGSIPSLIINLSHLREFQFLQNNSKDIVVCVHWWGVRTLPQGSSWLFIPGLAPPPLINSCLPQPTGTQGSSWKLSEGCFL